MILFLSTTLLYVAALHMVRKQYTVTFAWQMENRESAGKIEMADLSKEVQEKTEGKADNSSNTGPDRVGRSFKAGSSLACNLTLTDSDIKGD